MGGMGANGLDIAQIRYKRRYLAQNSYTVVISPHCVSDPS
jgi:hypothetical protein